MPCVLAVVYNSHGIKELRNLFVLITGNGYTFPCLISHLVCLLADGLIMCADFNIINIFFTKAVPVIVFTC